MSIKTQTKLNSNFLLCSQKKRNLCVVGDEDQSIFILSGADINNILDFESLSRRISFETRAKLQIIKNIINAAGHVISQNKMRKGKICGP